VDAGLEAEIAFDVNGNAKAGMGPDAGDVNGDGPSGCCNHEFQFRVSFPFLNRGRFLSKTGRELHT